MERFSQMIFPKLIFDLQNNRWVTRVPVNFASTSDIIVTGAIINFQRDL
jgi:hypothetical protein